VSHTGIAVVFAGASLVALALLVVGIRTARRAGDLDSSTALTLGVGVLVVLPDVLVAVTGTLQRRPDVFRDIVEINPGWYQQADQVSLLLLAAFAAYLLLPRVSTERARVHATALFAVFLWAIAQASSALHGGSSITPRGAVLLLCLFAAAILPRGRGASLGAGIFGLSLGIAGGILSLFRYDVAFVVPCEGACSGLGFTGALPNENLLGVVLTACVPFAWLGFRGRVRLPLTLYLVGMAIATGSRTAAAASVIVLIALLVVRPEIDQGRISLARRTVAWLTLLVSVVGSVYIVQHDWPASALTTRPALWSVAWHYIDASRWFGYGPGKWESLYRSSEIPVAAQHTTHNQWTDVLIAAGAVGTIVFVCVALAALWTSGRARTGVVLVLATISLIGSTEGAWSIGTLDLLSFSLVALILVGEAKRPDEAAAVPAPVPSRRLGVRPRPRESTR
jgi:O-antigen ligase